MTASPAGINSLKVMLHYHISSSTLYKKRVEAHVRNHDFLRQGYKKLPFLREKNTFDAFNS